MHNEPHRSVHAIPPSLNYRPLRSLTFSSSSAAHLDAALTRPGRLDVHVRFDLADTSQIESLFGLMMLPSAREAEEQVKRGKSRDEVERERGEVEKAKMAFGKIVPSGLLCVSSLFSSCFPFLRVPGSGLTSPFYPPSRKQLDRRSPRLLAPAQDPWPSALESGRVGRRATGGRPR